MILISFKRNQIKLNDATPVSSKTAGLQAFEYW
jgi:hypothetical protein